MKMKGINPIERHVEKIVLVVFSLALLGFLVGTAPADEEALAVVERFHKALEAVLGAADELDYAERAARLAPTIDATFASRVMVRIASGQAWRDVSAEDRERVAELFAEFTTANFAARLDEDKGQVFEVVGHRADGDRRVIVEARVRRQEREPRRLDYVVARLDEGWQVIDILGDGRNSELARRRAEFGSILRREGVEGLIATLENKIAELAT